MGTLVRRGFAYISRNFKSLEGAGVYQSVPSARQNGKLLLMGLDAIYTKKKIPKGGTQHPTIVSADVTVSSQDQTVSVPEAEPKQCNASSGQYPGKKHPPKKGNLI